MGAHNCSVIKTKSLSYSLDESDSSRDFDMCVTYRRSNNNLILSCQLKRKIQKSNHNEE